MASWMIHLQVAEKVFDALPGLSETEFIMGNIAPDSGVPNADWSSFTPSTFVSHFRSLAVPGGKNVDLPAYVGKYFTQEQRESYSPAEYAFFLGYYCHLVTDILWSEQIYRPVMAGFSITTPEERAAAIAAVKEDWYDLDFRYLRDHPDFRAFQIYRSSVGFQNTFMEEFAPDAFDDRRAYITEFYLQEHGNLDREYPYLAPERADQFVEAAAQEILRRIASGSC